MATTKNINDLITTQTVGWADALLTRLGAGHIGNANRMTHSVAGAASAPAVHLSGAIFTGGSATTTKPQFLVEPAGATSTGWGTAGTLIGANAASGFAGNLFDGQLNGVSKFKVDYTGVATHFINGLAVKVGDNAGIGNGIGSPFGTYLGIYSVGVHHSSFDNIGFFVRSDRAIGWAASTTPHSNMDVILLRDAANTLAQRNGTNAQAFNIYNTYTSGSVYERGFMRWVSNVLEIGTEHVGATQRTIRIRPAVAGQNSFLFDGGALKWFYDTTEKASILAYSHTFGTSGGVANGFTIGSGAVNVMTITSATVTNLRVNIGGDTSSFPSLKRSTTILQARLADDSDFATYQGKLQTNANAAAETPTATHTLTLYDAAGTAYKVLAVAA